MEQAQTLPIRFWKDWSYARRGSWIGFLVGFIFGFITILLNNPSSLPVFLVVPLLVDVFLSAWIIFIIFGCEIMTGIMGKGNCSTSVVFVHHFLFSLLLGVLFSILGRLIGWILEKSFRHN